MSVDSCDRGDLVLVVWAEEHHNYQLYHEGPGLHFLHTESLAGLGLLEAGQRVKHITAEVVDKEYCQAKKSENRFRVRQGTKFYRVRCRAVERAGLGEASMASSLARARPL